MMLGLCYFRLLTWGSSADCSSVEGAKDLLLDHNILHLK